MVNGDVADTAFPAGSKHMAAGAAALNEVMMDADIPDVTFIEADRTVVGVCDDFGKVFLHKQTTVSDFHIMTAAGHYNSVAARVVSAGVGVFSGQGDIFDNNMACTVQNKRCRQSG